MQKERLFGKTLSELKGVAENLKANLGDSLVIVSQGADGSIANDLYEIVGILDSGDPIGDKTAEDLVDSFETL